MTNTEIRETTKKKVDQIFNQVDKLEQEFASLKSDRSEKLKEEITALKAKRDELTKKLEKMKDAEDDVLADLKEGSEELSNTISERMTSIKSRMESALSD